ncbi:MAG: AAA family ATPase [Nitrospiraceae bacterium]|nr:MAG: AAA family ATPase [Nitrospiraceae bacterium]
MEEVQQKMWAIGGGKGGVGKSIVTLLLGASLAATGKKVILVDADLGGSNLHTLTGIKYPPYSLEDFLTRKRENIEDILIDTPLQNVKLICGADDILELANPLYSQKMRIFNNLKRLDADFILLDLGAGISYTTMDFFLYAPNKITVLTPQATSIQNAYGFIKASLYRGLSRIFRKDYQALELIRRAGSGRGGDDIESVEQLKEALRTLGDEQERMLSDFLGSLNIYLIVNMVRTAKEKEVGTIVSTVARNYLSLDLKALGIVHHDPRLEMSINSMARFLTENRNCTAGTCTSAIAQQIMNTRSLPDCEPSLPPPARPSLRPSESGISFSSIMQQQ